MMMMVVVVVVVVVVQTDGAYAVARSCSQLGLLRRCNDVVRHRFAILLLSLLLLPLLLLLLRSTNCRW